jgi:hypothetical protein
MRKALLLLGLSLATALVLAQFTQFEKLIAVLQQGQLAWIVIALLIQAVWQVLQAIQFRAMHRLTNVDQSLPEIFPVVAANNFLLVAAPSANASSFALFIYDARQRGLPATRVLLAVLLCAVYQDIAHSLMVLAAFYFLALNQALNLIVLLPAVILFLLTILYAGAMYFSIRSPVRVLAIIVAVLRPLNRIAHRFRRRDLMSESAIRHFTRDSESDLRALGRQPLAHWNQATLVTLGNKIVLVLLMATVFLAFNQKPTLPTIVVGVATASLFTMVSPTPLGVGVAESAMALLLTQMGVPAESALVISLVYRAFTFWLPMVYGFFALEWSGLRWYKDQSLSPAEVPVEVEIE